jgi:hypothetical protein
VFAPSNPCLPDWVQVLRSAANMSEKPRKRWASQASIRLYSRLFDGLGYRKVAAEKVLWPSGAKPKRMDGLRRRPLDAQDELTRSLDGQLGLEPAGETRLVSRSCSGRHSETPAGRVVADLPSAAIHLQERGNPPQDRSHSRVGTRELTPDPLCKRLCRQMPFRLARERVQNRLARAHRPQTRGPPTG